MEKSFISNFIFSEKTPDYVNCKLFYTGYHLYYCFNVFYWELVILCNCSIIGKTWVLMICISWFLRSYVPLHELAVALAVNLHGRWKADAWYEVSSIRSRASTRYISAALTSAGFFLSLSRNQLASRTHIVLSLSLLPRLSRLLPLTLSRFLATKNADSRSQR